MKAIIGLTFFIILYCIGAFLAVGALVWTLRFWGVAI